jgi:hypothetical protein
MDPLFIIYRYTPVAFAIFGLALILFGHLIEGAALLVLSGLMALVIMKKLKR